MILSQGNSTMFVIKFLQVSLLASSCSRFSSCPARWLWCCSDILTLSLSHAQEGYIVALCTVRQRPRCKTSNLFIPICGKVRSYHRPLTPLHIFFLQACSNLPVGLNCAYYTWFNGHSFFYSVSSQANLCQTSYSIYVHNKVFLTTAPV